MLQSKPKLMRWLGVGLGSSIILLGLSLADKQLPLIKSSQAQVSSNSAMTLSDVNTIVQEEANNLERPNPSQWKFELQGQSMLVLADEQHNRIRVVAPITSMEDVNSEQVINMLIANYHTSLDARYAVNQQGMVVSVFLHPLDSLQEDDLRSALSQVSELAATFGSQYSSGELNFDQYRNQRNQRNQNQSLPEGDLSI